ncbi:MAG TPA: ABC transporter substrate-binding protein [Chloroflexota bacterium]|nr:ABC transporter substrate-binding protein [Chloroflexota bacterium]
MLATLRRAIPALALVAIVACGQGSTSSGASGAAKPAAPTTAAAPAGGAAPAAPGGQTSAPAAAAAPVTIRYGQVTVTAMFWGLWAAEAKGFMQAENVTVEPTVFRVSSDSTRALSSDSVDMAGGTATDSVVLADEQGNADIIVVSGVLNKPTYSLITRPEVKTFTDLRGKTLAVSDLKDGSTILLQQMLQMKGVPRTEYDIIQAGGTPDRYAAVKSGGAAGALLTQPADFKAESEGFNNLGLVSDLIPDYQFTVNAVRRAWAQQNADGLVRFLRAYAKGCQWLYDPANKDEAIKILSDKLSSDQESSQKTYDLLITHAQAIPKAGEVNMAGVQKVLDIMGELDNVPKPVPPPSKYLDMSYLERARQ